MTTVQLRRGKEESLLRRHPWVFSGAIERIIEGDKALGEGDVVDVVTKQGDFIARGHYQIGSIAVRVLSFERVAIDQPWWNERIAEAKHLREALGMVNVCNTTCYRLVHGEGDMLPGLVIDIYGAVAVVQCHSVGMYLSRQSIAEAIREAYGEAIAAIYDKRSQTLPYKAELGAIDGYLWGSSSHGDREVLENGLKFKVNWEEGQKTGFFIDQRVNRDLVRM